jgi:hypothetical protein
VLSTRMAYLKPEKKITLETSQGRKIEWMLVIRTTAKRVYTKVRYKRQDMQSRSLTNPQSGCFIHPDTNDIRIVSKLLEYEFDDSDTHSVRLSLDEIKNVYRTYQMIS